MKNCKVFLSLLFQLLLTIQLSAQKVKRGPEITEDNIYMSYVYAGWDNEGLIVKKLRGGYMVGTPKIHQIQLLDRNLAPRNNAEFKMEHNKSSVSPEFAFCSNGKLYLFGSQDNKSLKKKFLLMQKVNRRSLSSEGPITKIAELNYGKYLDPGEFKFEFSNDSSKILISGNGRMRQREPETFSLAVFDRDMQPLWQREVVLPYGEYDFVVHDLAIDNNGEVVVAGKLIPTMAEYKATGTLVRMKLFRYGAAEADGKEYNLDLGDKLAMETKISFVPGGHVVCAGFYSLHSSSRISGTYFAKVDRQTGAVTNARYKEFDLSFIIQDMTEREAEKTEKMADKGKDAGLFAYSLHKLIPRHDGGVVLLAEQAYIKTVTSARPTSNGATSTNKHYYYLDVIVVSITPEGEIEWATKVPKYQLSVNDGGFFSSFATMVRGDKLYLLYNDDRANIYKEKGEKLNNFFLDDLRGIVVLAEIDAKGNLTRKELISNEEMNVITIPLLSRQVSANELVLCGKRGKTTQFALVSF